MFYYIQVHEGDESATLLYTEAQAELWEQVARDLVFKGRRITVWTSEDEIFL